MNRRCWAVDAKGQMALLKAAVPAFNVNPEGDAFIITPPIAISSIAVEA
jgi:hypothetical protein